MPCNNNCNQGRNCDCGGKVSRATVVVATLLLIAGVSMAYGLVQLFNRNKGQECAVEVRFKDSVATYIGQSV